MAKTRTLYRLSDGEPVAFSPQHAANLLHLQKVMGVASHSETKPDDANGPSGNSADNQTEQSGGPKQGG